MPAHNLNPRPDAVRRAEIPRAVQGTAVPSAWGEASAGEGTSLLSLWVTKSANAWKESRGKSGKTGKSVKVEQAGLV